VLLPLRRLGRGAAARVVERTTAPLRRRPRGRSPGRRSRPRAARQSLLKRAAPAVPRRRGNSHSRAMRGGVR